MGAGDREDSVRVESACGQIPAEWLEPLSQCLACSDPDLAVASADQALRSATKITIPVTVGDGRTAQTRSTVNTKEITAFTLAVFR